MLKASVYIGRKRRQQDFIGHRNSFQKEGSAKEARVTEMCIKEEEKKEENLRYFDVRRE